LEDETISGNKDPPSVAEETEKGTIIIKIQYLW
jgi:hypothetical protein